ncbi:hypothetical protein LSH36_226g04018 [Paralvinella palmiformis]|uniref:Uncharacterized protein n=1 Tax=Paralvinella palmiformis TaxID=53620 RepID=A0AAD9N3N1_9ANNE|nr:hypothetical protein LSH36_226g04018 [Paralvinella palmiformis]
MRFVLLQYEHYFSGVTLDRRDLVGSHGALDQLGSSGAPTSFSNSHRLRHPPTTADFQPPYFPPPYSVPQQPVEFAHHHMNPEPYAHLNHYNAPHHQQYVNPTDRHHLLTNDPLTNSLQRGFPGYDTRRPEYMPSVSRPDVLIPPRGPHDLHDSTLLGIPATGISSIEDAQAPLRVTQSKIEHYNPDTAL